MNRRGRAKWTLDFDGDFPWLLPKSQENLKTEYDKETDKAEAWV